MGAHRKQRKGFASECLGEVSAASGQAVCRVRFRTTLRLTTWRHVELPPVVIGLDALRQPWFGRVHSFLPSHCVLGISDMFYSHATRAASVLQLH